MPRKRRIRARLPLKMRIRLIKALLNGHRLPHGYALVKRKRRK